MVLYRIKDWSVHFENNRTRELKKLDWVPVPNKMDGDGYTELLDHPDGAAHFGAWVALVEIASKCDPRGNLVREARPISQGGAVPHDSRSLSRISRIRPEVFDAAIPRLLAMGWLESEVVPSTCDTQIPQESATIPHPPAEKRLWKGREGNRREGKEDERRSTVVSGVTADAAPPEQAGCESDSVAGTTHKGTGTDGTTPARTDDPAVLTFPTVKGKRGGDPEWTLTQSLVREFNGCYPDLDVLTECRRALAWINASTGNRKTADGMRRFLLGWLGRAQNRGGARNRDRGVVATVEDGLGTDPELITPELLALLTPQPGDPTDV